MANIKSAKKRVKVNAVKALNNKSFNSSLKTTIKKAKASIENNDSNKNADLIAAVSKIDKAVSKGLLHKNTAAKRKSKLQLKLNKA